jgi:dTDP-4-dehydrorhamnose reductase
MLQTSSLLIMRKLKDMNALILGGTGLLGKAFVYQSAKFGYKPVTLARKGADINSDASVKANLYSAIESVKPAIIINTIAQTNLQYCEDSPQSTYLINSYIPLLIALYCADKKNIKFCHISTDHYFNGDKNKLHDEKAEVLLRNEYAKTKYAGECFALSDPNALILRTNIVGFRNWKNRPTFVEWVLENLIKKNSITMFDDFFTSSLDARTCARIALELIDLNAIGLFNVGSNESSSKESFIRMLATKFGFDLSNASVGSVHSNASIPRCDSLGLDVSKAEQLLGYRFPSTHDVVDSIAKEYEVSKNG